jgi:hypothetical protein
MKKIIVISIVMLLIGVIVLPVLGTVEKIDKKTIMVNKGWIKYFEGTIWSTSVIQTSDGGYLVGGGTGYHKGSDALLIKTDAEGNQQWRKTFGDSKGWDTFWGGLLETKDGGFVASGTKDEKSFLVKVDIDGNTLWEKTYGGLTDGSILDVQQTSDNGFILTGRVYLEPRRGWLIKTDGEGDVIWSKTLGGEYPATLYSVGITNEGGFILAGYEKNPEKFFGTGLVIKTDALGNVQWQNTYESCYKIYSGLQTLDGGYIFTGFISILSTLNIQEISLLKTDAEGNVLWIKTYGTPILQESSFCVQETSNGGYIIIGNYMGFGGAINFLKTQIMMPLKSKMWLLKTDAIGNLEWDKKLESGLGRSVKQTSDGGFIIAGQRGAYNYPEGILLIKTDESGNIN